jgi:sec-independent protein translocase protein TatA
VIILLVFGAKRLPEMGRSLGTGLRGFKEAISGETHESIAAESNATPVPELIPNADVPVVHAASATAVDEREDRSAA